MRIGAVIVACVSAVSAGAGVALHGASAAAGEVLIVLGAAGLGVAGVLWRASARQASAASTRTDEAREVAGLEALATELVELAEKAGRVGALALADARVSRCEELLRAGAERVIAGAPAGEIRNELDERLGLMDARSRARGLGQAALWRSVPIVSMGAVIGVLVSLRSVLEAPEALGASGAGGLAAGVLGAVVLSVLSAMAAGRCEARAKAELLAGSLVIEAVIGIRTGEPVERLRDRLFVMIRPGAMSGGEGVVARAA